jgi:hypothetical protein
MKSIEPCDHVPVYKRIELGVRRREPPAIIETIRPYISVEKQEQIWAITRQTAIGTNAPAIFSSEYIAPDQDGA